MRYTIRRQVLVAVKDKDCKCSVSVSASAADKRTMYVQRCSGNHGKTIQKLQRMAEQEVSLLLPK